MARRGLDVVVVFPVEVWNTLPSSRSYLLNGRLNPMYRLRNELRSVSNSSYASCFSLIFSLLSPHQALAVPLRLQWFSVLFCPIFGHVPCPSGASTLPNMGKHVAPPGHIFFSCRAQNLPFSMTVRIKCPSAFCDGHRPKIESGYHSRNTDLSSRSNNFYIRQKPGYPP